MAYIQKRKTAKGKTHYRVMIRRKGYPTQCGTFPTRREADDWASQTETAIRQGKHFKVTEARRRTLGELLDRYIEEELPRKPRTGDRQKYQLEWWKKELGQYTIADVQPPLISDAKAKLFNTPTPRGSDRSEASVNRYLAALSHAFTRAVKEWHWAEENPVLKVSRGKESEGRDRILSDDERVRLLKACRKSKDRRLLPLFVLALSTGARQGELMRLRRSDINLEAGVAILRRTKNDTPRPIPIQGYAKEVLTDYLQQGVRRIDDPPIFTGPRGRAAFPRLAWERALKAAEIDDFIWHDLRHCAATELAKSGATLSELAATLGHKTLAMVMRYQHLTAPDAAEVVGRMNDRLFGGVK